jgi:hypothetical protein
MLFNARCWTPPRVALGIAMISLSACERVGSETLTSACPPVVKYSQAEQTKVADEVAALPEGARIVDWLADYHVVRMQLKVVSRKWWKFESDVISG